MIRLVGRLSMVTRLSIILITPAVLLATTTEIATPTSVYTSSTTLMDAGPQDVPITSLSDGTLSIGFSGAVVIPRAPVPVGWQTWASPPATEGATPRVDEYQTPFSCSACTVTLSLSQAVKTFGFEIETDPFPNAHTLDIAFYDGALIVASWSILYPTGISTAELVAATTTDQAFTSVSITSNTDFATARFRYSVAALPTPEPRGVAFVGVLLILAFVRRQGVLKRGD